MEQFVIDALVISSFNLGEVYIFRHLKLEIGTVISVSNDKDNFINAK